jgi:hypothetical protein
MRTRGIAIAVVLALGLGDLAVAGERDQHGLGEALARQLIARRASSAIHTTDFQGTDLGCIILPRRELRPYGYPGHAFLCEHAQTGEVLGAVLNRTGRRLCDIQGAYSGNACYDLDICGYAERLSCCDRLGGYFSSSSRIEYIFCRASTIAASRLRR